MPECLWMDVWMWRSSRTNQVVNLGADLLHYAAGGVLPGTFLLKKQSRICSRKNEILNCWRDLSLCLSKCSCTIQTWKAKLIYKSTVSSLEVLTDPRHCISLPVSIALYFRLGAECLDLRFCCGLLDCRSLQVMGQHTDLIQPITLLQISILVDLESSLRLNGKSQDWPNNSFFALWIEKFRNLNRTQKDQTVKLSEGVLESLRSSPWTLSVAASLYFVVDECDYFKDCRNYVQCTDNVRC